MSPLVTAGREKNKKKCNTIKEDINIVLSFHLIPCFFPRCQRRLEVKRAETLRIISSYTSKPLVVLARRGALRDAFGLTPASCLSSIGPAGAMEPQLTWADCLGRRPNRLAPCQTPDGPKLRRHKQMGPQRTRRICTPTGRRRGG